MKRRRSCVRPRKLASLKLASFIIHFRTAMDEVSDVRIKTLFEAFKLIKIRIFKSFQLSELCRLCLESPGALIPFDGE